MASLTFMPLMAPKAVLELPDSPEWEYEAKLDGYRGLLLREADARVRILSRNDNDLTRNYPSIARAAARMPVQCAALDGEIVGLDAQGRPDFQALQHPSRASRIVFCAFDVLHLDGRDLRNHPLEKRRALLPSVVGDSGLLISAELRAAPAKSARAAKRFTAAHAVAAIRDLGLEGVVAKLRDSPYDPGLENAWQKYRIDQQQEFVIGGYQGSSSSFESVIVGYYKGRALYFAGKVRAGFIPYTKRRLFEQLKPLVTKHCPFADLPNSRSRHWTGGITAEEMASVTWVRPRVVIQVRICPKSSPVHYDYFQLHSGTSSPSLC